MNNSNIELILKSFLNAQRRLGVFRMILYCSEELFSLDPASYVRALSGAGVAVVTRDSS
jgi:hypothetical protein